MSRYFGAVCFIVLMSTLCNSCVHLASSVQPEKNSSCQLLLHPGVPPGIQGDNFAGVMAWNGEKFFQGEKITFNCDAVPFENAVKSLLRTEGVSVVISSSVSGNVDAHFHNLQIDEVLDTLLKTHNVDFTVMGNIAYVGTSQEIDAIFPNRYAIKICRQEPEAPDLYFFRPKHVEAHEMLELLQSLVANPHLMAVHRPSNTIIASLTKYEHRRITQVLEYLERRKRPVIFGRSSS